MSHRPHVSSRSLTIAELLTRPVTYSVPHYQRDFAWTTDEVQTLWDDIITTYEDSTSNYYFLGAIVLAPGPTDTTRYIVDGQQRLATVSMLLSAIAAAWHQRGDPDRASDVSHQYLGSRDRATRQLIPKLKLNDADNHIFNYLILEHRTELRQQVTPSRSSHRRLCDAYHLLTRAVQQWLRHFDNPEQPLIHLEHFLAHRINLILIEVSDDADAFVIFETLNDRGLALAVSDLVKNYLFSLAKDDLSTFMNQWNDISTRVGSHNLTQFLRHYWLSARGFVRERELYRELKRQVRTPAQARALMARLDSASNCYAALENPSHEYWDNFPPEVFDSLRALSVFGVAQYRPVALAALQKFSPNKATQVLRQLMVVSFRYTIVGKKGTGNLERIYTNAATAITKGEVSNAQGVFAKLREAYIADEAFMEDFVSQKFTKAAIARYVLCEINNHMEGRSEKEVHFDSSKITLEHILPRNPGSEWKDTFSDEDELTEVVEQIGNLTILERGKNRGIANAPFDVKRSQAFGKSDLALNREIVKCKTWNASEIRKRSKKLAKVACKIWRVDY